MQTILIIDDHPLFRAAIRDIIGRLFAAKGWDARYREASSFREAFDHATAAPDLDLVTLDIYLPDSNDLSSLLRFRAKLPATPIVVISAIEERETMTPRHAVRRRRVHPEGLVHGGDDRGPADDSRRRASTCRPAPCRTGGRAITRPPRR